MISWMPSCYEPGEENSSPLILGPGDGLLDHVAALEVVSAAHTNLSPAVRAAVDQTLARPELAIPASAWLAGGTVDPAVVASLGLPVQGALRRFRCRPSLRPDLGLGRVWLRHDGRVLLPSQGEVGDRRLWWVDMPGLLAFRWDAEQGVLLAFGLATPGEVVIGFDIASPVDLLHWEGTGTELPVARRFGLDELDRPALPVTTPSVMQWSLQGISAQTLDVAVAVLDVGLVMGDDGRLVRQSGHGDGVTFAVELVVGGDGHSRRLQGIESVGFTLAGDRPGQQFGYPQLQLLS